MLYGIENIFCNEFENFKLVDKVLKLLGYLVLLIIKREQNCFDLVEYVLNFVFLYLKVIGLNFICGKEESLVLGIDNCRVDYVVKKK